ncbi:MAG: RNA-binding protein [Archaeoglobaceae archaeon]
MEPNDFRLILADKGINEIKRLLNALKTQKRREMALKLEEIASKLQGVRYCYMPAEEVAKLDEVLEISRTAEELKSFIGQRDFSGVTTKYWLEYLEKLPELMGRGEITKVFEAIRFFSGDIVTRKKEGDLWLCVFDCGSRLEIATNTDFKGRKVVSYLPPRRFGSFISQGMFVDAEFGKKGELTLEEIRSISEKLREVETVLVSIMRD